MASILITGFGPFPGAPVNPTASLVAKLARIRRPAMAGEACIAHVLPTSYAAVDRELPALIARHRPRAIVMFGLAGRSKAIRVEWQARNRVWQVLPDARGFIPLRGTIGTSSAELRSRAPLAEIAAAMRSAGLAVQLSRDAGRYLCNYAYWRALEAAREPGGPRVVVFIHVPGLRGACRRRASVKLPTLDQLVRGAQRALIAVAASARR